jgi:hypothetical protein
MSEIDIRRSADVLASRHPRGAELTDTGHRDATPGSASGARVLSFYRRYARRCQLAAQNAPNEKQRFELNKMARVWSDFAVEHERMVKESGKGDFSAAFCHSVRGWM